MALVDFSEQLERADSVLDLARLLGVHCLASGAELREMKHKPRTHEELTAIEILAGRASLATWEAVVEDPARLETHLGAQLVEAVRKAKTRQPLDFLGVLCGLCAGPLEELFRTTAPRVELTKGMPVPFADRPPPDALGGEPTTMQDTINDCELLAPLPFELYSHIAEEEHRVILDFTHAERLDALTWEEERKLPLIATVHPAGGGEFHDIDVSGTPGRFFGPRLKRWDPEAITSLLKQARAEGARLAILPELSLPKPDALEAELAGNHAAYPPIVVAGSAHHKIKGAGQSGDIRANESRLYLEGERVAIARKHHRYKTRRLGEQRFDDHVWEDLTAEQKTITVLSGHRTRLGVAICADLLEKAIPRLLVDAGVNLLLAPAMTPKIGSFNLPLVSIACSRQGIGVIANTRWGEDGEPFLCMCAAPFADPARQSQALTGDGNNPAPQLAIFDPNRPLPEAVSWPGRAVAQEGS